MIKFADSESSFDDANFVIYGYPFEGTACFRKGTALAPDKVREESYNFETYLLELGIDLCDLSIHDQGNLLIKDNQIENETLLEDSVRKIINKDGKKFPIGIGGEHSMTPPIVRAIKEKHSDLSVVIIDAHLDFRKEYEGNSRSHATTTYQLVEMLGKDNVYPIGIRSASKEEIQRAEQIGFDFGRDIDSINGPVYLSLDMDAIDPAYAPAVGTPEPFGLTPLEVIKMIDKLSSIMVGFDCVETCPPLDNGNTSSLAARIVRHVIGADAAQRIY